MSNSKKTIVVEDRLKEVFYYLKPIVSKDLQSFVPIFKGGDQKELLAFFKQSSGKTNYPLIWLDMPYDEEHLNQNKVEVDLSLILAVETNSQMLNSERIDTTYKPILYPLLDDILNVFRLANTISFDSKYKITKFPNYSDNNNDEESGFSDIWDAIKLNLTLKVNNKCLREIKN